jgi:hypothetical protein
MTGQPGTPIGIWYLPTKALEEISYVTTLKIIKD